MSKTASPLAVRKRQVAFALLLALLMLSAGCHALKLTPVTTDDKPPRPGKEASVGPPGQKSFRVSQFVFYHDFDLKRDQPIFQELTDLRNQVYKELQLPPSETLVQVYLFEDRDRYEHFMHVKYPNLPRRRAFFVAQPHNVGGGPEDLLVYTFWGDRVQEDLRHELTHALLHSVLKDVPLWLDEGLAEYFELPPDRQGTNVHHLEFLRGGAGVPFQPNLIRLEQLSQVQQMNPAEYREAWAWVHLMLRDRPEAKVVLLAYLKQLRTNPNPGPVQPRLAAVYPSLDDALQQHLDLLDVSKRSVPTAQRQ